MIRFTFISLILLLTAVAEAQLPEVSAGQFKRHVDFQSNFVDSRNIDIWLPEGYSSEKKYAVLYMHDGQMLFDASTTWNKQEWGVDEVMTELISNDRIKDCIVVGIWNNDQYRHAEYFPQRAWDNLSEEAKKDLASKETYTDKTLQNEGGPLADRYLKFIVQELKPFIDKEYSTYPCKANTFIIGSSMGGLISCYAISEYPGVFGGAACLSTHWPAVNGEALNYFKNHLPNSLSHLIYFDYGTETLDALYEPYQLKVDQMMLDAGYVKGINFQSLKFEGADHSEKAWNSRLHIPLEFLLKK